jgi:hypothetical protein
MLTSQTGVTAPGYKNTPLRHDGTNPHLCAHSRLAAA